jgi:hypothetical protein
MILGSSKELHPSRIIYIGQVKRLNDYYALNIKNGKGMIAESDAACRIDPSVFNMTPTQPS